MSKYRVLFNGEYEGDVFDTEEQAEEYAFYLVSCAKQGAEILYMSNPGDYDPNDYEDDYKIEEIDD